MSYQDLPPQPSHPEFNQDNQPVSEATLQNLVNLMREKMGTSDGWTGVYGDAFVLVDPIDTARISGNVGYLAVPIDDLPDQHITSDYSIRSIPDGYSIEKVHDYDVEAAGGPSLEEIDDAFQNIRDIFAEEGLDLLELSVFDRLKMWMRVSEGAVAATNPQNTHQAITAQERELGLLLVTEGEAKRLIGIVKNCITAE